MAGTILEGCSGSDPDHSLVPVSRGISLVVEGPFPRGPWTVALSTNVRFLHLLPSVPEHAKNPTAVREKASGMDVLCQRCAGLDVSKRDAKVCVRVTGPGGRVTVETTTWTPSTK